MEVIGMVFDTRRNVVTTGNSDVAIRINGQQYRGFDISFLRYSADYGCPTTALVVGQHQLFFILRGNHVQEYQSLITIGFEACFQYFKDHIDQAHEYSDRV